MEIPEWAVYKEKPTVKETVQSLIEELPYDYDFFSSIVHRKLVTVEGFNQTNIRRTREALQTLFEQGLLKHTGSKRVDGRLCKMYRRIK
jgi:hypothetical protein